MYKLIKNNNQIKNTLIVSPPMRGKTTLLRDIVRNFSNGFENFKGVNVGVVDERNEIVASFDGTFQNEVGIRTDALINIKKDVGIDMILRTMNPKVIAIDEIGMNDDLIKINEAFLSGIACITTLHGSSIKDVERKINNYKTIFDIIIFLSETGDKFGIKELIEL